MPAPRDPALLSGATARQWRVRGFAITIVGILGFVVMSVLGEMAHAGSGQTITVAVVCVLLIVLGRVCAGIAIRKMQLETRAGYSTMLDLTGYDLRESPGGRLLRPARQLPAGGSSWAASFGPNRATLAAYRAEIDRRGR